MKRKFYESPRADIVAVRIERGFAASEVEQWYDESGKGDFGYEVENDETWG